MCIAIIITWNNMKISFLTARIVVSILFFSQQSFGMNWFPSLKSGVTFSYFTELIPETQFIVFKHSDNKNNFQKTNRNWYIKGSIKSPDIFSNDFCHVDHSRMIRILLNAAYVGNYAGVENILKKSTILGCLKNSLPCTKSHHLYYSIDSSQDQHEVLDMCCVTDHTGDEQLWQLLESYTITNSVHDQCKPTELLMACLVGSSDIVSESRETDRKNVEKALKIAVDCDHGKCMKVLIDAIYDDSNFTEIIVHFNDANILLNEKLLERACVKKSIKALEALLDNPNHYNLNYELGSYTDDCGNIIPIRLLDKMLDKAQEDPEYDKVVLLLENYGARSGKEIENEREEENDVVRRLFDCTIS